MYKCNRIGCNKTDYIQSRVKCSRCEPTPTSGPSSSYVYAPSTTSVTGYSSSSSDSSSSCSGSDYSSSSDSGSCGGSD